MENVKKKYGLWTSIAMVVGIVIGSGVFFKADDVLIHTEGNVILALVAWVIGATAMVFGALVFAEFAQRIEKANGIVDYSEAAYGKRFGYLAGWFKWVLYYTPLSAILAWVSSLYTLILFNVDNPSNSTATWVLSFGYFVVIYTLNILSPILAGKFQVSATVLKLVPLILVSIVGTIAGLVNGVVVENFTEAAKSIGSGTGTLASAVVATAFAYEGWIVPTTINNEIKDSKKNLPLALTIGTLLVFVVYVTYFLGINAVLPTDQILGEGDGAVYTVASTLFGSVGGTILTTFVVISCLGTLNGLVLASVRIPYSLAVRNHGPLPKLLSKVNKVTNISLYSALFSFVLALSYIVIWYGSLNNWFGQYIGLDEIPIVLIYGLYTFLYIWYMVKYNDLGFFKRFVVPVCALFGALIILYGGITNSSVGLYLIVSLVVLAFGLLFYRKESL